MHLIAVAVAIAHQTPGQSELTDPRDRGQRMADRQRHGLFDAHYAAGADQDRTNALLRKSCEGGFDIAIGCGTHNSELPAQYARGSLQVCDDGWGSGIGRVHENAEHGSIRYHLAE